MIEFLMKIANTVYFFLISRETLFLRFGFSLHKAPKEMRTNATRELQCMSNIIDYCAVFYIHIIPHAIRIT